MLSNNPLDILFRDIKKELWLQEVAKAKEPKPQKQPPVSKYADPQQWTLGKVIQLNHSTEGDLGLFQEYFHKTSPNTRRLLPAAVGLVPQRSELVFGDFWLHPQFQAPPPPYVESEAEILAIQNRFAELMLDLDEDFV